jgi:hypothetical protein
VELMDTTTGKRIGTIATAARNAAVGGVFSADGRCLAFDMNDGTVTLYELATGQVRRTYGTKLHAPDNAGRAGANGPIFAAVANYEMSFWGRGEFQRAPANRVSPSPRLALAPGGKSIAYAGFDRSVRLWDTLTGQELAAFNGHNAAVLAVAFAPDSKTVASASADTTALIWDVTTMARAQAPPKVPQPGELEAWWQQLTASDAAKAFAAMGDLAGAPQAAVALIKQRLQPAALDRKRALDLIGQLDHAQYKIRETASNELYKMGEQIVPELEKVLANDPSPEARTRLDNLRAKLTGLVLQGERLRSYRAVEILEIVGTPEARLVLQVLAEGAPDALVTQSAQAALKR